MGRDATWCRRIFRSILRHIQPAAAGLYTFFANWYFDKMQKETIEDLEKSGALEDLKNGKIKE